MISRILILLIILLSLFESGCNSQNSRTIEQDIDGEWYCQLKDGECSGIEKIKFENNSFIISDSLFFSAEDSEFRFSMVVLTNTGGEFRIRNDSVFLTYRANETAINPQSSSYKVDLTSEQEMKGTWDDTIKSKMREDLEEYLQNSLEQRYNSLYDKQILLGKITAIKEDAMCLMNSNTHIILFKDISMIK